MDILNLQSFKNKLDEIYGEDNYNIDAFLEDLDMDFMANNNGEMEGSREYEVRHDGKTYCIPYHYKEHYTIDEDGDISNYSKIFDFLPVSTVK